MMGRLDRVRLGVFTLFVCGFTLQGAAADDRFEVTSIKAVRPTLVDTVAALQQKDIGKARDAFEAYDGAWNGIEVYINTRSKDLYNAIELDLQARINKELAGQSPDFPKLVADAQAILAKYDEAIAMVAAAPPLNPLYDDVARLRIVRAPLREVIPALKVGKLEKARKSYEAFDSNWDSIEDLIKARSEDSYVAIEKAMIQIEQALMPDKPDVAQLTTLVNAVMTPYNAAVADITKDARARK